MVLTYNEAECLFNYRQENKIQQVFKLVECPNGSYKISAGYNTVIRFANNANKDYMNTYMKRLNLNHYQLYGLKTEL